MPYDWRLEELMEPFFDVNWVAKTIADRQPVSYSALSLLAACLVSLPPYTALQSHQILLPVCHARSSDTYAHIRSR